MRISFTPIRLTLLICVLCAASAQPFDELSFDKFKKMKISSFKIIAREVVYIREKETPNDSVVSGYRIVEYSFPAKFHASILSHRIKFDTLINGTAQKRRCSSGWGFCIVNNRYKIAAPCGFSMFAKSLVLVFSAPSQKQLQTDFSLRDLGTFLKEITISDNTMSSTYDSLIATR
jgi:hypothetical protein